jgi:hypothetical protein
VSLHRLRQRLLVEIAQVVGDLELVADEVPGGEVQLVGVDEGEDRTPGSSMTARRQMSKVAMPLVPPSTTVGTPMATPIRSGSTQKSPRPAMTWVWRSISPGVTT